MRDLIFFHLPTVTGPIHKINAALVKSNADECSLEASRRSD